MLLGLDHIADVYSIGLYPSSSTHWHTSEEPITIRIIPTASVSQCTLCPAVQNTATT